MALIPPGYLNAIVSLGCMRGGAVYASRNWLLMQSGPLHRKRAAPVYRSFLVTNRHVAQEDDLSIRFNRITSGALEIHPYWHQWQWRNWTMHPDPDVDVAVLPVSEHPHGRREMWWKRKFFLLILERRPTQKYGTSPKETGFSRLDVSVGLSGRRKKLSDCASRHCCPYPGLVAGR